MTKDEIKKLINDGISEPDATLALKAIEEVQKRYKSSFNELLSYRRNVPILIRYISDLYQSFIAYKFLANYQARPCEKNNKRWTEKEDNDLIELICSGVGVKEISAHLQRTPNAIQTRLSYLVGVKRLSQSIEGKFIGIADGEKVEQELVGTLYRK